MLWPCHAKPKFHYVDFATKSPDFVADFLRVLSGTKFHYSDTDLTQKFSVGAEMSQGMARRRHCQAVHFRF